MDLTFVLLYILIPIMRRTKDQKNIYMIHSTNTFITIFFALIRHPLLNRLFMKYQENKHKPRGNRNPKSMWRHGCWELVQEWSSWPIAENIIREETWPTRPLDKACFIPAYINGCHEGVGKSPNLSPECWMYIAPFSSTKALAPILFKIKFEKGSFSYRQMHSPVP